MHELGACLLDVAQQDTPEAAERLTRISAEAGSLMVGLSLTNPDTFKRLQSSRLDQEDVHQVMLPDSFYAGLLVSNTPTPSLHTEWMAMQKVESCHHTCFPPPCACERLWCPSQRPLLP